MIRIHLLSTSLRQASQSRETLESVGDTLRQLGAGVGITDLRTMPPVLCDGRDLADYPAPYGSLAAALASADGVVIGMPVHSYSFSGPCKNLLDIVGAGLANRPVGVVSAAGSLRSHLAVRDLLNVLWFDHQALLYPRTVQIVPDPLDQSPTRITEFAHGFLDFSLRSSGTASVRVAAPHAS